MSKLSALFLTLLAFTPYVARAAYLQCAVVDYDTGRALARSTVTLEAVQSGQTGARATLRTDRAGVVSFGPLADGAYIVTVGRAAFATQQYGQKGWNRPGTPLSVQGDRPLAIQIRLRRLGAISGTLWDENQVGIPGAPVLVYSAARPVKIAARGTTDDRGIFRVGELVPGAYYVRSAAKQLDDGLSILPTFYPGANPVNEARLLDVDLDHSPANVDFPAAQGRLFRVTGRVTNIARTTGVVELISDTGRTSTGYDENGGFSFEGVAPGTYELSTQSARYAGWTRLQVDRDLDGLRLDLVLLQPIRFQFAEREGNPVDQQSVKLFARRKDLDADGPVIPLMPGRTALAPGSWEIAASTIPSLYPVAVHLAYQSVNITPASRADGWNPIPVSRSTETIRVVVSSQPASLHGRVAFSLNEPAAAAPVFLETLDLDPAEPPQVRTARTDQNGNFLFTGLPPGRYHLVASYDLDLASHVSIEAAHPRVVSLRELANETQDLELSRP